MSESVHEITVRLVVRQKGRVGVEDIPWGEVLAGEDTGVLGGHLLDHRELEVKECANETCAKPFIHQEGRAETNARRKDAIYCSSRCARAQAQREYRRRQKANG